MAKGDKVNVVVDVGSGQTLERSFVADAAGREVAFTRGRDTVTVEVRGRAGTAVRTAEFRADRVILIEEVPK